MKIHLLDDVHLEFGAYQPVQPDCDVVVLAGDIAPGVQGLMWAREKFSGPIVAVAGNHEFYGKRRLLRHYEKLRAKADELGDVHFLERDTVIIDGVRFIGATLWTDFGLNGDQPLAMERARDAMNDYQQIKWDVGVPLRPQHILDQHNISRAYIERELSNKHDGPTVVVTHHAPSIRSIHEDFRYHDNTGYASRLEHLMFEYEPEAWLHGHVHRPCDYVMGETRVLCNPRGYDGREKTGWNPSLVFEV
jgi:predicted phosphodiesterase